MSKELDDIRLGLAQYHSVEYDREHHFWRDIEEAVLKTSVREYVRRNSPEDTSHEEVYVIAALTLKELKKLR